MDQAGNLFVTSNIRYAVAVTPSGSALTNGPCDAVLLSADANVTFELAEQGTSLTVFLRSGFWHAMAMSKVTVVSTGTLYAGWIRNPTVT